MQNRWFHRPTLHSPAPGRERKVGWLELFYDLIYVATIIQLGTALSDHIATLGVLAFLAFAGLFVPIWVTWTNFTLFSNRFVVDDFLHRALVFVQMFGIGGMAVMVPRVLQGEPTPFVVSLIAVRAVIVVLYARVWRQVAVGREMTRRYTLGFGLGVALWTVSIFVPEPYRYLLWAVAIGVDFGVPLSPGVRSLVGRYPPDALHMSERFGLFIIIVLGESFVKVLTFVAEEGGSTNILLMGGLTILITCSLWWIYFDDVAGSRIRAKPLAPYVWLYTHLPLTVSITAVGVAIKKAVAFDPLAPAVAKYAWLLCGALGLVFLSVAIIDSVTARRQSDMSDRARVNVRAASAFLVLLLAPAAPFMPAWAFLSLVAGACVLQVIFDLSMAPLAADPHAHHHDAQEVFERMRTRDDEEALARQTEGAARPRRWDVSQAVQKGTPNELRRDLYFHFMDGSWLRVFVSIGVAYLLSNVVFATLYMLEPPAVSGLSEGSFLDAFAFSVQTMTTIGYGAMSPASAYAHVLVTVEAAVGLLGVALVTGLVFAKASRPRTSVLFSDKVVIHDHDGVPTLVFRVGNARGNDLVEATIRVVAVKEGESSEGQKMRVLHDLALKRDTTPLFAITWTVMHPIDERSPLYGLTEDDLAQSLVALTCTLTAYDATYAQSTHARKLYYPEDIRSGHRFVDVISSLEDGRIMVDYEVFHDTVPLDAPPEVDDPADDQ